MGRGGQQLFVHWDESIIDISRAHVSRWIVETIKEAYNRADLDLDRVRAHEVRAISSSWAYLNQIPLDNVLAAAFWRSQEFSNDTTYETKPRAQEICLPLDL